MKISVILVVLNEAEFIEPCIKAIYPFVDRIRIQTNYDRSWSGEEIKPDQTIGKILEIPDQEGKISLHITRIPDEALARNWLMRSDSYKLNHEHQTTTSSQERLNEFCEEADYFWVIDGDEIYDPETIPNIIDYLLDKKPKRLFIRGINYFKTWNYKVVPPDDFFQPGFIKPNVLFYRNRNLVFPFWNKIINRILDNKYWTLSKSLKKVISEVSYLPEEVGVFHHGSYVGNDKRMSKKIQSSVHYETKMDQWYYNVWQKWTPQSKNFHPIYPTLFQSVEYVPTNKLPISIKNEDWPNGYISK